MMKKAIPLILFFLHLVNTEGEVKTENNPTDANNKPKEGEAQNQTTGPSKANDAIDENPDWVEEGKESTCNLELLHSYKLFPINKENEDHTNYLCPYISQDCCSFNSQKMIQVLWVRISQPRLQRVLTKHLFHIESIINHLKDVFDLFVSNELPEHEKYSAECLESINDMHKFIDKNVPEKLDFFYENIKKGFNILYKFKKQFYCEICNQENQEYYNVFDKQVKYSNNFCAGLSGDFKDISWFLNYELIEYYETIRNYILCYKEKNYLLTTELYKFQFDREELRTIAECRDHKMCQKYCNKYSTTDLPEFFIGKEKDLEEMKFFLDHNKPDNRGFFTKDIELTEDQLLEQELDELEMSREDKKFEKAEKEASGVDLDEGGKKDFFDDATPSEQVQWELYKNSFDMHRKKMVKKKMAKLRRKVMAEYEEVNVYENFLTMTHSKLNLIEFKTKLEDKGLNPYTYLDKENLFKTNANLTLFNVEISNTVKELQDLNETDIIEKMVNVTKMMNDDPSATQQMQSYIEAKIFKNMTEAKANLIENPYINIEVEGEGEFSLLKSVGIVLITVILNVNLF